MIISKVDDAQGDTIAIEPEVPFYLQRDDRPTTRAWEFHFPEIIGRGVDPGFFGGNFQFEIVPEPSSFVLCGIGFL